VTATQNLESEVNRFLASTAPEVLAISGEWGIGKTFLWRTILGQAVERNALGLKRHSYVSLFGIDSLEALKLQIFENTKFIVGSTSTGIWDEAKKKFNAGGKAAAGMATVIAELAGLGSALSKAGPLFFATVKEQIICIDDLERRSAGLSMATMHFATPIAASRFA